MGIEEPDWALEESHIVRFGQAYAHCHGYISLGVCVFSILANAANVVVLTRRKMWSPSNLLLTAIAFADILKMTSYCAFAVRFSILSRVSDPQPFGWMLFLIGHTHIVLVLHAITTWLTVTLASFRYFVICTKNGARKITIDVAKLMIALATICSVIMYIPQYVAVGIMPYGSQKNDSAVSLSLSQLPELAVSCGNATEAIEPCPQPHANETATALEDELAEPWDAEQLYTHTDGDSVLYNLSHIIHGPVLKLLASVLITVPTAAVIAKMRQAAKKHVNLMYNTSISSYRVPIDSNELSVCNGSTLLSIPAVKNSMVGHVSVTESVRTHSSYRNKSRYATHMERHHRTTLMLVAVVISFVIAELPQGVLLLIGCFNDYIQEVVYYRLSDFVDLLVLLYSAINFILYCSMSQQFRTVFKETFIHPIARKKLPFVSRTNHD